MKIAFLTFFLTYFNIIVCMELSHSDYVHSADKHHNICEAMHLAGDLIIEIPKFIQSFDTLEKPQQILIGSSLLALALKLQKFDEITSHLEVCGAENPVLCNLYQHLHKNAHCAQLLALYQPNEQKNKFIENQTFWYCRILYNHVSKKIKGEAITDGPLKGQNFPDKKYLYLIEVDN